MDREEIRRQQMIGMAVGVLGGIMTANFFPNFREGVGGFGPAVFLGAAIGAFMGAPAAVQRLGLIFTRDPKKEATNLVIGMLVPILFILSIYWFVWR